MKTGAGAFRWVVAAALLAVGLAGCGPKQAAVGVYQGYLDGRFLGVSSPQEGQLQTLTARRGDWVEAGAPLFTLDPQPETDELREEEQHVASAQSHLDDLGKGLRPTELAALQAQLDADRVALKQANSEWERNGPLQKQGFVSTNDFDRLRTTLDQTAAQVSREEATLATGQLPARVDQVRQAAADLAAAEAVRDRISWLLAQKTLTAPQAGFVQDTLFRAGERVTPDQPVVVLLPATELRVRFYVPEPEINRCKNGDEVSVILDGKEPLTARISLISTQVEFTPPVIYSRDQNYKYVFLVEADFDPAVARGLHAGQPAEVRLRP